MLSNKIINKDYITKTFTSPEKFRVWLLKNHRKVDGLWVRLFKKDSGIKSITPDEALIEALCFGWIDGQGKTFDEQSYLLKFTPRRKKSLWSKRNVKLAELLIKEKRMTENGLMQINQAKEDGRWVNNYR